MPLDLDASSAVFLYHTSDRLESSLDHDLGTALGQPMLDLDSGDDDEMGGEEMILDF